MTQVAPHAGRHSFESGDDSLRRVRGGTTAGSRTGRRSAVRPVDATFAPPDHFATDRTAPPYYAASSYDQGDHYPPHGHGRPAGDYGGNPWARVPVVQLQDDPAPPRGRHATSYGQNFGSVVVWTILGGLLPGSGLIAAGRRVSGWIVFTLAMLGVGALGAAVLLGDPVAMVADLLVQPDRLLMLTIGLGVVLLAWMVIVLATHAALRRHAHLGVAQRTACSLLVVALVTLVAVPTAKAGSYALITRDAVSGIFTSAGKTSVVTRGGAKGGAAPANPWANIPRVNVLLLGSDAGADRIGIRPDTLILASIDTTTGNTVLFSLPRNLQHVPFPPGTRQAAQYPNGYYCENHECLLNAFWMFGEQNWQQYYPEAASPFDAGLRATSEAVEQVTGLHVDQYAMLNLRGFIQFVNAVGGITVNVRERLPIGGNSEHKVATGWIEPGVQHLDGYYALWYGRSRWSTDDYDRMRRQRCVIAAVVNQADPATVARSFPQIAAAAKDNISTDIPLADLGAWVELTKKVKGAKVRSLPFTSAVVDTVNPDFAETRRLVAEALHPNQVVQPSPTPSMSRRPTQVPSSGPTVPPDSTSAQDINAVC